ncbi:MAG: D-alanyl-D-alanine carboxypeptidase family protein [Lachnospiraceae bacterium]|nr:D-alanyl-D-alanine carboxypeptidase family protein [Lachnospiraceae bacterium]
MKKQKIIIIFLTTILIFMNNYTICYAINNQEIPKDNELHASSALLMDGDSGRVLYEKNGYQSLPMASTTKIMTCLYTLEHGDLSSLVTVSSNAASAPQVKLGMKAGETYQLGDLLYSLMLESHNDTAIAIAEAVEGSVENFCKKMTKEAKTFGCKETCFKTPNGLDEKGHHTTAYELALITREALKNDTFRKIIKTPSYELENTEGSRHFSLTNHDAFLSMYDGAIGVKTGFTGKAGYCFVGAVESEGRTFITAVLASGWPPHKSYKWADTKKLMDYAVSNYHYKTLLDKDNYSLPEITVENGRTKLCQLYLKDSVSFLTKDKEIIHFEQNIPDVLTAPVKKNTAIGNVTIYLDDHVIATVPVYTKNSSKKITFCYCFKTILFYYLNGFTYESP